MTAAPVDLPALRGIESADVHQGPTLAGRLARDGNDVIFTYDEALLDAARAGERGIAWTLPRRPEAVRSPSGTLPPFFAGLLPEGIRLQAVVSATKTSIDDHLTLLLAVGRDAIGDVRVLPPGESVQPDPMPLSEDGVASSDLLEVFATATSATRGFERVALPGVQAKVSAALMSAPVGTDRGPAILKLNQEQGFPRLVENEHYFLAMAAACGLRVPEHRLVHDRSGRSGLLVRRFDRAPGGVRLAQEDACQVLGVYPAGKYRLKTEEVVRALAAAVAAGGGSRRLAVRHLFELVAFCYLIGNGDLHGKNFSIRRNLQGFWEVTPAYDLLSTQPYLGWRDPMALDLYGRANRLDRRHLLEAARRLDLPSRAATSVLDRICAALPVSILRLAEIGFDDRTTSRLAELMDHRLHEVRGDR